jgi:flavin-dependent dehydrogenase
MSADGPSSFDAIVIGGGPGGSSAAAYLRRAGRNVLVLEKEVFPRFHIGESLLPYNQTLLRELGVLPEVLAAGFPRKTGAQFYLGNGAGSTQFVFAQGKFTREKETVQVERAKFDHIMLKHARKQGADVREGWLVQSYKSDAEGVMVTALDPDGKTQSFRAAFLIDASGRGNLSGNQEGLRELHANHRKVAVFSHFTGVYRDEGERGGDTVIVRLDNKWFWIIPVSADKTSVGLVIDKDEFGRAKQSTEEIFRHWIKVSPPMAKRMMNAKLISPLQITSDFSYFNRTLAADRVIRVGDAAGFMDPIFSAGIFLAMWSGKLAVEVVVKALEQGNDGARLLERYEKRLRKAIKFYWRMVEHYYTQSFMELFLQPRNHYDIPAAVNAVLAGELEPSWAVRWRLEYFFLLVKLQTRWPLVPRLSFSMENPGPAPTPAPQPQPAKA